MWCRDEGVRKVFNRGYFNQFLFVAFAIFFIVPSILFAQKVRVSWSPRPESNIVQYKIYRSVGDNQHYSRIATVNHPTDHYYDNNVDYDTHYYYAVSSVDDQGLESEFSSPFEVITPEVFTLSVSVNPSGGGSVTRNPDKNQYVDGETVTLTATPEPGYQFDHWGGDASGTNSSVTISMTRNKSVTAYFSPIQYSLNISIDPSNSGSVNKSPDKSSYNYGEQVTLTANAASGYSFDRWSGDASGTSRTVTITMNGNKNVIAQFAAKTYSLNISVDPSNGGSVSKSPDKSSYNYGEQVTLTANPALGYSFDRWSGDASGASQTVTITMNGNKNVTAQFAEIQYTLTIHIDPPEAGIVIKIPDKTSYSAGESVRLKATANSGYRFNGWSGDLNDNRSNVNITVHSDMDIVANFREKHRVGGYVVYRSSDVPIAHTQVMMTGDTTATIFSDQTGYYEFDSLDGGKDYYTLATKEGEFDQAYILSYDAAIAARIALNLHADTSRITRIAADADQNREVQMFDAALIAQYAVGLANPQSKIGDWAFAPENRHYANLDSNYLYQDFNGTIIGDVDGNWHPAGYLPKSNVPKIYSYLEDQQKEIGEEVRIPFISEGDREILSFDIKVRFDCTALRFVGFEQTDLSRDFQLFLNDTRQGEVVIGGFGIAPITDTGEYLQLVFEVIGNHNSSTHVELISYRINAEDPQQGTATVVISSGQGEALPTEYALLNNFPNPFNPETSIKFQLPQQDHVVIKIFNMIGQEVRTLIDEDKAPGTYQIKWDGKDDWGNIAPSGNYVYRMQTKRFNDSRRMVFLK